MLGPLATYGSLYTLRLKKHSCLFRLFSSNHPFFEGTIMAQIISKGIKIWVVGNLRPQNESVKTSKWIRISRTQRISSHATETRFDHKDRSAKSSGDHAKSQSCPLPDMLCWPRLVQQRVPQTQHRRCAPPCCWTWVRGRVTSSQGGTDHRSKL